MPAVCRMIGECNVIQEYANRLRQGVNEDAVIREFRRKFYHRFQELCMVHLSFLIDIPWNIFDQRNGNAQESTPKSALKRLLAGSRVNPNHLKSDSISDHLLNNVLRLIDRLDDDQACSAEGIFRKPGHMQRKRQLHDAILQPQFNPDTFPWSLYTVHDLATALKSILVHLPSSPLLTDRLMPLFLRVAGLREPDSHGMVHGFDALAVNASPTATATTTNNNSDTQSNKPTPHLAPPTDTPHWSLIESKQLKALRILVQLLPPSNKRLFKRLIQLLTRVARLQESNRMTGSNLGTVFAPVLFPRGFTQDLHNNSKHCRLVASECHDRCKQLSAIVTILVEAGSDIFLLPRSLAEDVHTNHTILSELLTNSHPDGDVENCKPIYANANGNAGSELLQLSTEPIKGSVKDTHFSSISSSSSSMSSPGTPETTDAVRVFLSPGDSPPLHTGIRFATPTLGSHASKCQTTISSASSPWRTDNYSSPPVRSTEKPCRQGCNKPNPPAFTMDSDLPPLSSNGLPSDRQLLSSPFNRQIPRVAAYPAASMTPRIPRRSSFVAPCERGFLVSGSDEISMKHAASIPDLDSPTKRKPDKKRRYTELRLPCTINRTGPRRHLFSPCPPLGFLPFRRGGGSGGGSGAVASADVPNKLDSTTVNVTCHAAEVRPVPTW